MPHSSRGIWRDERAATYSAARILLAALLFALCARARAQTPDLRLQILNGKTGRPITNTHVTLWREMNHTPLAKDAPPQFTTDGEGYAAIPANDSEFVVVTVDGRQPCSKTFEHTYSLTAVRTRGFVSENACNAHIHMFAAQGTLIVFVRDLTWYERMRGIK